MNKIDTYSFDNEHFAICDKFDIVLTIEKYNDNAKWKLSTDFSKSQIKDFIRNDNERTKDIIKFYPLPLNWIEEQPVNPQDITDDFI